MRTYKVLLREGTLLIIRADRFDRSQMALYATNAQEKEVCLGVFNMDEIRFVLDADAVKAIRPPVSRISW